MEKKLKIYMQMGNLLIVSLLASKVYSPLVRQLTKYAQLREKVKNLNLKKKI